MTPLVKARDVPASQLSGNLRSSVSDAVKSAVLDTHSLTEDDIIRTNTNLVSMNVSVFSNKLKTFVGELKQGDFRILEDGQQQEISFFASTDMPFDLVLLIDLSGSTSGKRDLIRKSTQRFIEAARPTDRIAIVTFADTQTIVSPLTDDRPKLLAAAKEISGGGGSKVWDALKFTLDQVVGPKSLERRKAIVMMTDGADNSMGFYGGAGVGSTISFADLLDAVGRSDTLVVPIYLDTESDSFSNDFTKRIYSNARKMLQTLASESAGSYYTAKKVADLNGVYEQVINDLGKIYSLGYKPTNDKRDATWRSVEIQVINRPDLAAHAKPGYYAK
jgi:VWFA-related protein